MSQLSFQNQIKKLEEYFETLPRREGPLTLSRIKNLLKILGNPEKRLRGIHAGGTNGKGSVCAMCQSICSAAGYKVGLYTSPHLVSTCERIRINYKNISQKRLIFYLNRIKKLVNNINEPPTWFEALTCAAILYFVEEKVDVAVFEVGLGGRGDATNVLNLGAAVITNVQMDHKEMLGNTLEKICREKIEIIKKNYRVAAGCSAKLLKIIQKKCQKEKAKLYVLDKDIKTKFIKIKNNYTCGDILTPFHQYKNLKIFLLGLHQATNAALAITACEILTKKGFKISSKNIQDGLKNIFWPGRYQILSKNPKIIIDAGHNPDGIKILVKTFKIAEKTKKAIILFAAKKTKNVNAMLKILKPIIGQLIFVDLPEVKVLFRANEIKKYYPKAKILPLKQALIYAKKQAKTKKIPILICGSIYFLGEVLKKLETRYYCLNLTASLFVKKIKKEIEGKK